MLKLKCWRSAGKEVKPFGKEYFKIDDRYSFAQSFKTGLPSNEIKRRGIKPYIFMGRIGRDGKTKKEYFKLKRQSDKAMIDYVKEHDKC
ncbi:MAG: hypothetical protein AABY22_19345 [Nanoarchaeota archaeon]